MRRKVNPVVKKRQANLDKAREKALATHNERINEIRSYGIKVKDKGLHKRTAGGKPAARTTGYFSSVSDRDLQKARNKALKVNQREQLRSQNQEIAQLTFQRRRRSSGRQSLVNATQRPNTLGPTGTLG